MKRLAFTVGAIFALVVSAVVAGSASAAKPTPFTILDTLGTATPETVFSVEASGGITLNPLQWAGPEFTITDTTTITEIGAFIAGAAGEVQIRPARGGVPDNSVVIATLSLPTCSVGTVCYVSVRPEKNLKVRLKPGAYFALFTDTPTSQFILGNAQQPFVYQAGTTAFGFLNPTTNQASVDPQLPGAVRILGK
jgi:hypothetical protein